MKAKAIKCITTNKRYETIREAYIDTGVVPKSIRTSATTGKPYGHTLRTDTGELRYPQGLVFEYMEV